MSAAQPRVVEAAPRGEGHIGTSRVTREAVRFKYSSAARGAAAARRAPRGIIRASFPQEKEWDVNTRALLSVGVAALAACSVWAQEAGYPIEIVKPGTGSPAYPPGYQTPWDRVQIMVTSKMSPNLFVLHGSEGLDPAHPDASGGRVMVLFGPDGVLMVDTENSQVADKTLAAIRSFTSEPLKVVVNSHIHGDHTGANAYFGRQGAVIFSQENLRMEMLHPPPRANGQPAPAPDMRGVPLATYKYSS